jgi:murein DD-endopeptidase MepM/ murein hydrolase activator NlpD
MATTRIRRGTNGRPHRGQGFVALAAILATFVAGTMLGTAGPAWAEDYPTWNDVANARNNEAATAAQIRQIEGLLAGLQAEAERTQKDAELKGALWGEADTKFQAAASRALTLQEQADAANAIALVSEQRAGQMAAQLVRSGGSDLTATLLANSGDADSLLYGLGLSGKIAQQANAIYEKALLDKNTAQALTDQAAVARDELEILKIAAEKAFVEAQAASTAAAAALTEQQENQARLQQQLIVLKEKRAATEADYLAGVQARIGSGASLDAGEISLSGWARPVNGSITSSFGYRIPPTQGASSFHQGTDLGAGCGANIYASHGGTVVYAGWNGGYGNFVLIDHGGGVRTAYAHIVNGGILVSYGQTVDVGQHIAEVGTTGTSTGCHLHFEVRINGVATNPVAFMSGQGIRLG